MSASPVWSPSWPPSASDSQASSSSPTGSDRLPAMLTFARKTPCAVLLAVQFLGVLLYPFLEGSFQGRQLFSLFGLLVLAIVVFALRVTPALTWVATILALPAFVLLVVQIATANDALLPWAAGFEAALYFYGA